MKTLYLIVAKSGTGKDYIVDKLCEDLGMTRVISRTTRLPRNKNDKHIFVSELQADVEFDRAVAKTVFNGHRYYVLEEDLVDKDLYIIDVQGVESLKNKNIAYVTIYIDSPWYMRLRNMRKRGDNWKNIISRLWHDRKAFAGFIGDIQLENSDALYRLFYNGRMGKGAK